MNNKKVITGVIIIAALCVCISGGLLIWDVLQEPVVQADAEKNEEEDTSSEVSSLLASSQEISPEASSTEVDSSEESTQESQSQESQSQELELVENPYASYFLENEDMVAWLSIPGMEIDYPVMQTPDNEEYYLRRGFDGSKDNNGCLILDTDSSIDPVGTNLMIHGHNMKSGKMFGTLMEYAKEDFCQDHKTITLTTEEFEKTYEVMAVFYSQVYKKSDNVFKFYKFFQADTESEFQNFYDNIMKIAEYDTGVTAEFGDHLLTLVTCSYHVDNGRFVVVAKEVATGAPFAPIETQ